MKAPHAHPRLVVIGNGMAGMRTVEELLKLAPDMYRITVFGAEPHGNYNRILLSPVLAGEKTVDDIMLNTREWYDANGITLHAGDPVVRVLPITHTPPANPADAIEIPAEVKSRLRLDAERSWIMLTESNRFAWPGPDLRNIDTESGYYGALTPGLFAEVKRRFVAIARGEVATSAPHRSVPRTE